MILVTFSVVVTIGVLNVNFRTPATHKVHMKTSVDSKAIYTLLHSMPYTTNRNAKRRESSLQFHDKSLHFYLFRWRHGSESYS